MATTTTLTIDQGNSSAKIGVFCGERLVETLRVETPDVESLSRVIERTAPDRGIYSSVNGLDVRTIESVRLMLGDNLIILTHATPLPVKIHYDTPHTLGADRIAAAVGAAKLFPATPLLVVDAGTCITLDLLTAEPAFAGGDIAPGVEMRLKAMYAFTHGLPDVSANGPLPPFGHDTHTAIRSGAINGAVAQVVNAYRRAQHAIDAQGVVLTGGDAPLLQPILQGILPSLTINPDLNAIGLYSILEYNENI